jgi:hypothetical protein
MRKTLYLHIGSHRTATTSIQQFMIKNFDALIDAGYLYPFGMPRHLRLMNSLFSGNESVAEVAETMSKRADQRQGDVTNIVLSDEDVSTRPDLSLLAQFQDHFDVKIVYSMRRQDLWLESWYFQNIKWQWNPLLSHCTFDEFLNHREDFYWIHYDRYVSSLEAMFGEENVLLTVFEKQQMPHGPVMEFCRTIGLTDMSGFSDAPHFNSSMSASMVEFVRHLPLDTFNPPERDLLRIALEQVDWLHLKNTDKQSERLMPRQMREEIMQLYENGNQKLASRRFSRADLFLDPLPDADAKLADLVLPPTAAELLEQFVAPLLIRLVQNGTISGKNQAK